MRAGSNRNADLHLADLLSREVEKTPSGEVLAEAAEDFGDRRALAKEFDTAFARAIARERRRRISDWTKAFLRQIFAPSSWKPAAASIAALAVVLVVGGLYVIGPWRSDTPVVGDQAKFETHRQVGREADMGPKRVAGVDGPSERPKDAQAQGLRDYAKALEWYEKAAATGNAEALDKLSRYALYAREFAQALNAAERALKADPELLWIAANRAHALMYLGRAAEAREAYLMHRDKRIKQNENKTWQQVIAEDFAELRKAGLDHPQMAEIEAAPGIAAPVWKAQSGSTVPVSLLAVLSGHAFEVERLAFSPDGRRLATASGGTVRLFVVPSSYALFEFKVLFLPPITALAFGPDNWEIFTVDGNDKHVVSIRDTHEFLIKYLPSFQSKVLSVVPTPEGLYVVTAADDNGVRLFKDNKEMRAFRGHDGPVRSAALSHDRKLVLTTSGDKTIRVWNAETGEQVTVLGDRVGSVAYAAFSPDGRRVVAISKQDPIAHVWDVATRAQLSVLKGHKGSVLHAAFSPDGRQVITASADGTARLWNADNGEVVAILEGHTGPVSSAAFSPDGTLVATTSQDGTARLWRLQK